MATPVKDPKSLNPSESDYNRRFNNIPPNAKEIAGLENLYNSPSRAHSERNTSPLSALKNTELNNGKWNTNLPTSPISLTLQGVKKRNKGLVGGLVGGGVAVFVIVLTLFFALIPMKLQGMLNNIMTAASEVPQHAIQQRVEYLVTRALASRMLAMSEGVDAQLIFCKGGGIACSLLKTYTNDYFEKKLGITLDYEAHGRTSLGGNAKSWSTPVNMQTIDANAPNYIKPGVLNGSVSFDETEIEKARKLISTNSEMKAIIKSEVNSKTRWYNINRYLARKLLMEKYGVRTFSGPKWVEAGREKVANVRSNMKASIIKNTTGKIAPRFATYMTCLSDPAACDKLKAGIKADIEAVDPTKQQGWDDLSEEEKLRQTKTYEAKKSILPDIEAGGYSEESSQVIKKVFSKSLMKTLGFASGAATAVSAVDIVFKMVESIDNGGPEAIAYDITTQAYTGFFTEVTTAIQKVMAGDIDYETLQVATELVADAENSPLYQIENNPSSLSGTVAATSRGYTTSCKGADGEETQTVLKKGEYICPEEYVVRDYTSQLANNPVFSGLGEAAKVWNSSVGTGVDWVNGVIGKGFNSIPGFQPIMDKIGGEIAPLMEKIISMIFDVPAMGFGELGSHNYTALSGGLRVLQNTLMEEGVDSNGKASGAGGKVLTNEQITRIYNEAEDSRQADFMSKSIAKKLFDTNSSQSFINQLVARIPISLSGLSALPITSLQNILSTSSVGAVSTTDITPNPFHLPVYGYDPADTSVFEANPDIYTPEYCAASAAKREASYERRPGDILPVYHETDPCALEKVVIGSELAEQGIEGDEYSFLSIQDVSVSNTTTTTTAQTLSAVGDVTQDSTNIACAAGTEDVGNVDGYKSGKKIPIKICAINNTQSSSGEDAKYGKRVVVNSRVSGAFSAMIEKMRSELGISTVNFTSSFRSNSSQSLLYTAYTQGTGNQAARPGYSNHQLGTALDFKFAPDIANASSNCKGASTSSVCKPPKASTIYDWLTKNASTYGYSQLYNEYWHWEYKS